MITHPLWRISLLGGLALAWLAPAAQARPRHLSRHSSPPAAVQQRQSDGIVSGVVDRLWRRGDVYWHTGDYPRIVALDRVITEADPQFLEAYATGGWLMDSLGRTQDAEAYYMLGTRNNPRSSYAYWNLGMFYFVSTHDYPAAARALLSDTEQAGADLNDWKMLAHAQEHAGQWEEAVATWYAIKRRWPAGPSVDRLLREAEEGRRKAMPDAPVPDAPVPYAPTEAAPADGKPATP